jgi:hypothetical protein
MERLKMNGGDFWAMIFCVLLIGVFVFAANNDKEKDGTPITTWKMIEDTTNEFGQHANTMNRSDFPRWFVKHKDRKIISVSEHDGMVLVISEQIIKKAEKE